MSNFTMGSLGYYDCVSDLCLDAQVTQLIADILTEPELSPTFDQLVTESGFNPLDQS